MITSDRKRRIVRPALAILALGYLTVMGIMGTQPVRTHLIQFQAKGVMAQQPETITSVKVTIAEKSVTFVRDSGTWRAPDGTTIIKPALIKSLDLAVKFMHTAEPVRTFKIADLPAKSSAQFGLSRPSLSITLRDANAVVVEADFGNSSADGLLHYMRVKGRDKIYLMSRFVRREWQSVFENSSS